MSVFAGVQIYFIVYRRSVRVAVLSLVIPTLCAFASTAAQWEPERFFVGIGNPCYRDQLELVETHVPENAWVAAGQSGTLGYFRNHVINLDGKVNPVALEYQRKMPEYLRQLHVNYLWTRRIMLTFILVGIRKRSDGARWEKKLNSCCIDTTRRGSAYC